MPHVRTQLRDALEVAFQGLVTPANVYVERRWNLDKTLLPAAVVYLTDCDIETDTMSTGQPYDYETDQTITVELHVSGTDSKSLYETIDQMELEVEAALAADLALTTPTSLGGLLENLVPNGSSIEASADQEPVTVMRAVNYLATWRHTFGAPDTPEG